MSQADSVLDRYQDRFEASPAYIMDQTGSCIASSNRDAPDSFVGHNYGFRPYFQQAIAGQPGRYFAVGVVSKKRGFFAAYPVRDPVGKIMGVAAIKTTLDKFQQELREGGPAFLIDPSGIIFLSSRPSLDYHGLWPVSRTDKDDFKAQYGTDNFESVFPQRLTNGAAVKIDGNKYLSYVHNINASAASGWSLVLLAPVKLVVFYRLMGIATAFIMVVLTLVFAGTNLSIREGANRIMASEARFRAMFAAAPEAVFVFDPESRRILGANPFMAQWLGYAPEELVGLEIDKLLELEPLGEGEEGAGKCPDSQAGTAARRYRKKDGSLVDVECTEANILHEDHIRKIVFVRDITERKQAEAELKKSLSLYMATLESTTDGLLVVNRQGRIVSANKKFRELWHMPEEIVTSGDDDRALAFVLDQLEDPQGFLQRVQELYSQPAAESFDMLTFKDGRVFERYSVPHYLDNQIVGRVWSFRDVTASRQAENEVREGKEYLENILENSADPIGIVDQRGRIIQWNKASEKAFGYSFEELKGKPSFELYADNNELQEILTQLRRDGSVSGYEIHMKRKDGSIGLFALSINLLYDRNHKANGSVCVARDLSEIKKALDDLATVNRRLQYEVTERKQMEGALQAANLNLQEVLAQVEERNRAMTLANDMADMLQACQISEEAYEAIGHFMPRFFPEDAGALYMLNNSRNHFAVVASWGQDPPAVPVFAPDECWSVRRGRIHQVENPQEALGCRHVPQTVSGGYLCIPLIAQGETLGVFHVQFRPQPEAQVAGLAVARNQLAVTVAEDMALALANLRLRETLRSQAIRDPLTGLFNRRYLEETMERELNRVRRQETTLGVIMMDLDHFKEYNDTFGHSGGDGLLSALGILLKSQIRGEDIACRYGGEEFLLILPGASLEVSLERAESLRQAVKEMHEHHPGLKPTTLSLGVAVYPTHGDTGLEIIKAADAALYRAKEAGRDRVMAAEYSAETMIAELPIPPVHRLKTS